MVVKSSNDFPSPFGGPCASEVPPVTKIHLGHLLSPQAFLSSLCILSDWNLFPVLFSELAPSHHLHLNLGTTYLERFVLVTLFPYSVSSLTS